MHEVRLKSALGKCQATTLQGYLYAIMAVTFPMPKQKVFVARATLQHL